MTTRGVDGSAPATSDPDGGAPATRLPLLDVRDLQTSFFSAGRQLKAVDGVSFSVARGHTVGLVGESGCGKSVTSLSLMGLVPSPPGKRTAKPIST